MQLLSLCIPNYFSMDDILATQERTPCKFLVLVPKLGKLNVASEDDDLKPGIVLELPLWLLHQISSGRQPILSVDLPRMYKDTHREILKADACTVDLHKFRTHFYEVGAYIKNYDNRGDVANILLHTFQTRFRLIMDLTDSSGVNTKLEDKLDILERKLFQDSQAARVRLNSWLIRSTVPIEAAAMVVNHRKRKRINEEDL